MTPQEKRKQTLIQKHGSHEAYIEHMKEIGSKGGKKGGMKGFALDSKLASKMGKKGNEIRWGKKLEEDIIKLKA